MKFRLINQDKERMFNALFPGFSDRLQVGCFRYWWDLDYLDSVIVTSGDNVDRRDSLKDEDYLMAIYKDEITPVFEEGDPFVTEIPANLPDGESAFCEYGPLEGKNTDRFFAFRHGKNMLVGNELYAALHWAVTHKKYGELKSAVCFDRSISDDALCAFLQAECKRMKISLF